MAIDEEMKVDASRPPEQSTPNSDGSTTTIDAEPTVPTEAEGGLSKEQQGIRKHLIALSIVLCQLIVVCGRFKHGERLSSTPTLLSSIPAMAWAIDAIDATGATDATDATTAKVLDT